MNPQSRAGSWAASPKGWVWAIVALVLLGLVAPADAKDRKRRRKKDRDKPAAAAPAEAPAAPAQGSDAPEPAATEKKKGKDQVFDFTGFELAGSMRMPQLLYFLDRAEEELARASLERRSFVPEMVRSLDEDAL